MSGESFDLGIGGMIADDAEQTQVSLEDRPMIPDYDNMVDWANDGNAILERVKGRESELCALKFFVGSWWNKGSETFGEEQCLQALAEHSWARDTVRKMARISSLVPPEVRREKALSFEHFGVIAKKELTPEEQEAFIDKAINENLNLHEFRELVNGKKIDPTLASESTEWGTPAEVIAATRLLFGGGIDLDPASSEFFNMVIQAKVFFPEEDDGLKQQWSGKVFLNPPYGRTDNNKSSAGIWSWQLIDEYENGAVEEAILVVSSATSEAWFKPLKDGYPICFPDGRLNFYNEEGEQDSPTRSNAIVYMGPNINAFVNIFSEIGVVMEAILPDGVTGY